MNFFNLKKITENDFLKNTVTLFSGSFIAQVIPLAASPFLTRMFSEEVFGVYFIYASTLAVLAVLSTLKYELTSVLPDKESDAVNLLALSLATAVVVSLLSALFIYLFYDVLLRFLDNDKIGYWLYLIPFSVLLIGFFQTFSYWHNRRKNFKSISFAKVLKSATAAATQLGGGAGGFETLGLIPGLIGGQFISALILGISFFKKQRGLLREITLKRMLRLGALYKNFPLFNTLMGLLNTLSNQLPVFLLTRFFGLSTAAYYGLANRIIGAPTGLIGQSVGQVFYQKAADIYNKKSGFYRFVKNIYLKLFLAAIPLFTALIIVSFFFGFIFGAEWETAGFYALILIPWLFVMFINSPITFIIAILNRQKQMVVYDTFLLFFRAASLYAGFAFFNSAFYSLFFFSLTGLIFNGILMVYLLHIARKAEE